MTIIASLGPADKTYGAPHCCLNGTRLKLLDGFRLERDGNVLALTPGGQRLLALLGLRGAMTRAAAAGALWPVASEGHAHGSLRTTLWRLGRTAAPLVNTESDHLELPEAIDVDVNSFTDWAMRLVNKLTVEDSDLHNAVTMNGDLLPGWYEDWVLFERERLRQLRLHALDSAASQLCHRRRYAAAIEVALEAIRLEPLRESAHRTLITIHICEENLVEALRHFRSFRRLLNTELGVEPSPLLTSLISERVPAPML
jgi:DNA-binding SARP family transcriptional activator